MLHVKQPGFGFNLSTKKTRKREFLEEMAHVVPWGVLVQVVDPVLKRQFVCPILSTPAEWQHSVEARRDGEQ